MELCAPSVISPVSLRRQRVKFYYICTAFSFCWRQKQKVMCVACNIWRCCNEPQREVLVFSQISEKCQRSTWYKCVSWSVSPWFLIRICLLLLTLAEHFLIFTSTIPLSRGCCGAWEDLAYFGRYMFKKKQDCVIRVADSVIRPLVPLAEKSWQYLEGKYYLFSERK